MQALIDDLRAEQANLDDLLITLEDVQWFKLTPGGVWDIRDTINHLSLMDGVAHACVEGRGEEAFARIWDIPAGDRNTRLVEPWRTFAPSEVLARWRENRERLNEALLRCAPSQPLFWAKGFMSARSFATARLMECWSHGLDCFMAVDVPPVDTDRLRHVCHLGYRALPYAFQIHRRVMPAPLTDLRIEVIAPSGTRWVFGSESASQCITGSASEWARVAVRRLSVADARTLSAKGPLAEQALEVAQAYVSPDS